MFALGTQREKKDKQRKTNPCVPNANYIPLARVGSRVGHCRLALGTISSRWALLACVGGPAFGPQGFTDTNMLVFPRRNHRVGGLSQRKDLTGMVLRCSGI